MADERLSLLTQVLAYVSSPFRLFAAVLMAVLTFAGYFVYTNQELLIGAYKESKKIPSIAEDRVEDAAAHLFKQSGALVVAVFKVNSMFGTRILYRAYGKNGRDKTNDGLDVGLFSANQSNNSDIVKLLANEIPCGEYKSAQSEMGLWYIAKGVSYTCRISVPPEPGRFVGQITVGWAEKPIDEEQTKAMLQIAATMLSRSKQ
ncbi:hypothetical protein UFOVP924_55 [uncultured Caudovirales phage]|uniref:Uncharacterized protein n=1 Tax=uncultured Caudovirales phage TaxID=2100421 RepID=A0A6J5S039_9CAUD|nr:hypothetical protein UFOVP924_55 [uncultured Caudovirales phage]CAB4200089.1 hypothetical protein UFOVP1348_26 [uncultured Caudovirales phage]